MNIRFLKNLAVIMAMALVLMGCAASGIDAKDWVIEKSNNFSVMQVYCDNTDDVVTLYATNAISTEDYVHELDILSEEFAIIRAADDDGAMIKPGSHSVETKKCYDAYMAMWEDLEGMTEALQDDEVFADMDKLIYTYLAYRESLISDMGTFLDAYEMLYGDSEGTIPKGDGN